jgi:hypothetical protein
MSFSRRNSRTEEMGIFSFADWGIATNPVETTKTPINKTRIQFFIFFVKQKNISADYEAYSGVYQERKIFYATFFLFSGILVFAFSYKRNMCGVFGIFSNSDDGSAAQDTFDALTVLQHRGQDAAGIASCQNNGRFYMKKGNGLVRDVIHTRHMVRLKGNFHIGHVRYPTAGCSSPAEAQPFYVNSPYGIMLAHTEI